MARVRLRLFTLTRSAATSSGYQFQVAPPYHVRAPEFLGWKCTVQDKLPDARIRYAQLFRRLLSRYELARVHVPSFTTRTRLTQSLKRLDVGDKLTRGLQVNRILCFQAAWLSVGESLKQGADVNQVSHACAISKPTLSSRNGNFWRALTSDAILRGVLLPVRYSDSFIEVR